MKWQPRYLLVYFPQPGGGRHDDSSNCHDGLTQKTGDLGVTEHGHGQGQGQASRSGLDSCSYQGLAHKTGGHRTETERKNRKEGHRTRMRSGSGGRGNYNPLSVLVTSPIMPAIWWTDNTTVRIGFKVSSTDVCPSKH